MTLEDHLGDIIRKARRASTVSVEAAAKSASLSVAELDALERSGHCRRRPDLPALASVVGLDGAKLERIADGWLPVPQDLGRWRELRVISTTRGGNMVNCCLIWDETSREAALFDTGWEARPVFELIARHSLALKHLFVTHSHEDHVAALNDIRGEFPRVGLHGNSQAIPSQDRNRPDDCVLLGHLSIANRATPGHADDGVIYLVSDWPGNAPCVAIIGDTIFAGSLATGFVSTADLKRSVRKQILTLPGETLLCPGHGPLTTVAEEAAQNPFF